MNTIAIDCGASFIKGALFVDGKLIKTISEESSENRQDDIFVIQKITKCIKVVKRIIKELSRDISEANICFSNEMHGFILAYPDGKPYTDYISWQRELISCIEVKKYLINKVNEQTFNEYILHSGMPIRSGLPSSNLIWLSLNNSITKKVHFYTLGDYLIRVISNKEPFCHPTNAAATGLYDLTKGNWNRDYINSISNQEIVFPPIGYKTISFCMNNKYYSVKPAIGDQQAALLGSGFKSESSLSFNIGTGAQVSRLIKTLNFGDYQIRPYFFNSYIKTIPHIPSGRALNIFFRFLKSVYIKIVPDIDDEKIWDLISTSFQSNTNLNDKALLKCDLSFFENAVSKKTKGSIEKIDEYNFNIDNLIRSIFIQMAKNFGKIAIKLNEDSKHPVENIIFSGGFAKRWPALRKMIVKQVNLDVPVVLSDNDTLYGCNIYDKL